MTFSDLMKQVDAAKEIEDMRPAVRYMYQHADQYTPPQWAFAREHVREKLYSLISDDVIFLMTMDWIKKNSF